MAATRTGAKLHRFSPTLKAVSTLSSTSLFQPFSSIPNPKNHRKQVSLANLLQNHGFPPSQIQSFLKRNNFLSNSNPVDIRKSLGILSSLKIPQKDVVLLVASCPRVLDFEFLTKWETSISRFGDLGLSPLAIKSVLEYSWRNGIDPDGFGACLRVLKGVGFKDLTVRRLLEGFPRVINMGGNELRGKVEFMMEIGIPVDGVDWVCHSFPEVLGFGVEGRLMPLLDEFERLGFSKELVKGEIIRDPRVLGMELGELSLCLQLLRSLKCREPIKMKILGDGTFRAGFAVKLRVDCLCKHGLIRREAFKVLWKEPRVIIYDVQEIENKIEYLVKTMGLKVGCLVDVPEYLGVNFNKQIVPRYSVIEHLRAKGVLGDEVGLNSMIKLSRLRFHNLYVKPYPECEKLFGRFSGDIQIKSGHLLGLWKVFKPGRPPESKEDVNNFKSFMEAFS